MIFLFDGALDTFLIPDALQVSLPNVSMPQTENLKIDIEKDQDSEQTIEEELSGSVKCLQHSQSDVDFRQWTRWMVLPRQEDALIKCRLLFQVVY